MSKIPFYDEKYVSTANTTGNHDVNTANPFEIYRYLQSRVYKQDEYCKEAAMILYEHLRGITSRNIVCGPAGCGKTYVWDILKAVFPRILVINAANLSKEGWSGGKKVQDFLGDVDFQEQDYIVVFDEFDKCATPQYTSHGENVSAVIQSEFLKLVEGERIKRKHGVKEVMIDTSAMTFVFCGSFAQKAEAIAESKSSSGFGFGNERKKGVSFEKELTVNDLMEFGVIRELASRCTRLINVRPLTEDDYLFLVTEHTGSPIKLLEKKYGMPIEISDEQKREIARRAFVSGLGVRNVTAQVQKLMDDRIFSQFEKGEDPAEIAEETEDDSTKNGRPCF